MYVYENIAIIFSIGLSYRLFDLFGGIFIFEFSSCNYLQIFEFILGVYANVRYKLTYLVSSADRILPGR